MHKIRCVLFDLGWTLVGPYSGDWFCSNTFLQMFPEEKYGSIHSEKWLDAFQKAYVPLKEQPYMKDVQEQIDRHIIFYTDYVRYAGYDITHEQAEILARDISTNDDNMYLLDTAESTLQKLKEEGIRIGVISDTWPNIESQLKALHVDQYFDQISYSYQLGVLKPDPRIFQDAIQKSGMKENELLFIDDIPDNLYAAKEQGMHVLQSLAKPDSVLDPYFNGIEKPADVLEYLDID